MRKDIYTEENGVRRIDMQKVFGTGYNNLLPPNSDGIRYIFCQGGRSTKKSTNMLGYLPIIKVLSDDRRNIVVCRKNDVDNRGSTFANIIGCIEDLGLEDFFIVRQQPLEIEVKQTHNKIVFRGENNPTGLKSIKFVHGYFTDLMIEEMEELDSYDDFLQLDGSLRLSEELMQEIQPQIIGVFNPPSDENFWAYSEFFRGRLEPTADFLENHRYAQFVDPNFIGAFGRGLILHVSTYKINEFRSKDWDIAAEEMKKRSYELYKTNFLGLPGTMTGLAYPEFSDANIMSLTDILSKFQVNAFAIGIDTGYSNGDSKKIVVKKGENAELKVRSATAMTLGAICNGFQKVVALEEYFHSNIQGQNVTNTDNQSDIQLVDMADVLIKKIIDWINKYSGVPGILMKGQINCYVDNADLGSRNILEVKAREYGLYNIHFFASTKVPLQARVDFERLMLAYTDLIVSSDCKNLIREYRTARKGEKGEARSSGNDHMLDSKHYFESSFRQQLVRWKTQFKEHS